MQVFNISEGRSRICVAGCRCTKGMLSKKKAFKVMRQGETIYKGKPASLWVSFITSIYVQLVFVASMECSKLQAAREDLEASCHSISLACYICKVSLLLLFLLLILCGSSLWPFVVFSFG